MKIEVLCTTMHQKDFAKYKDMNLQTDAVIANQANFTAYEEARIDGNLVKLVTTETRGVSLNRNIAIANSKADIIVFADDDQHFVDNYEQLIANEFERFPDADAIKFYCESTNPKRPLSFKKPLHHCCATYKNVMSAGVHCLAVRRTFLYEKNISFDERIGPGKDIYCGEDSVFLSNMLKKKATIYLSPTLISYVDQGESTWFKGYESRFYISTGYVYALIYGWLSPLVILRRAYKNRKSPKCSDSYITMCRLMMRGFFQGWKHR